MARKRNVREAATLPGCPVLRLSVSSPGQEPLGSTAPRRTAGAAGGSVPSQDPWTNNEHDISPSTTTVETQGYYYTGLQEFTGAESGRTSFFLDFFFVAFSGTLKSSMASTCRFLDGLASVVTVKTSDVRFRVRGELLLATVKAPSLRPTASSISRTNSSWTVDEHRSVFLKASRGALTGLFSRRPYRVAGFTSPVMFFFLRVK